MHLNSYTLPDACKANPTNSRVTLTRTEDNAFSLNVRQQTIGSNLYKLDLSSLDSLREALARQNQVDFSTVSGLSVETQHLSETVPANTTILAFTDFFILFNAKELTFGLKSAKRLPFDKAEAFLAKLDSASRTDRDFIAGY